MTVKDNTKVRFDELEGGDIFSTRYKGDDIICLKLDTEMAMLDSLESKVNAINILTGEPVYIIDAKASVKHQNVTLEID